MPGRLKELLLDREKRARLLFWISVISMVMIVIGYIIIFIVLFKK